MRHFAPWWMTVVCMGLASFAASGRVSSGTVPVTGGNGFVSPAGGRVGQCRCDGSGVLLFEVRGGCFHVFAFWQSVSRCSCRLHEVLVEEAVLMPFGKL